MKIKFSVSPNGIASAVSKEARAQYAVDCHVELDVSGVTGQSALEFVEKYAPIAICGHIRAGYEAAGNKSIKLDVWKKHVASWSGRKVSFGDLMAKASKASVQVPPQYREVHERLMASGMSSAEAMDKINAKLREMLG